MHITFDPTNPSDVEAVQGIIAAMSRGPRLDTGTEGTNATAPEAAPKAKAKAKAKADPLTEATPAAPLDGPHPKADATRAPTLEDVRAAYIPAFKAVGEEAGKEALRAFLASAGAANLSDLKPEHYASCIACMHSLAASHRAPVDPLL